MSLYHALKITPLLMPVNRSNCRIDIPLSLSLRAHPVGDEASNKELPHSKKSSAPREHEDFLVSAKGR